MRLATSVALTALLLTSLIGCSTTASHVGGQSELFDDISDAQPEIAGRGATIIDAPVAIVGASWNDPGTQFPEYLNNIVDPYNWPHLLWRSFYTVWTIPFNPLYHITEETTDDWDSYVSPVRETVAYDVTPTPHGGDGPMYWASRSNSLVRNADRIWADIKYYILGTNSFMPPYDRFYPEQVQADKTTIHKTFDTFLFAYDWDDPYID